jgi:nitrate reductase gamma subunit
MDRLTIFWILMAVTTALFFAGVAANLSLWLEGRVDESRDRSKWARLRALAGSAVRAVSGRRFWAALKALILHGLLHRALYREGKFRWLSHTSLALAFLALFALSTFTGFFEEILRFMFKVETPFVLAVVNKDTPIMALLNEVLGIPLILGLVAVIIRRYISRPVQLRTEGADTSILVLLGIGLLTSYPTEALRFLMEDTPASLGSISFIGYPLAQAIKPLGLHWEQWHFAMFFAHVLPFMVLLVYMPWSKFFHVMVSPIVAAANAMNLREGEAVS